MQYFKLLSILLFSILFTLHTKKLVGQETNYKNSIYFSAGTVIFNQLISLSYERDLFQKDKFQTRARINGSFLRHGLDYAPGARVDEEYIGLGIVQLIGIFEIGGGIAVSRYFITPDFPEFESAPIDVVRRTGPTFYGHVGLRYEKNRFLIKAGLGNLEYLYLGLGLKF